MSKLLLIVDTLHVVLRNWWKILLFTLLVGGLSAYYIVAFPRTYKSEVIMLPEVSSENSLAGGLGSMASSLGLSLGKNGNNDAIYPEFYPKVIGTPDFLCKLLQEEVVPKKGNRPVTLFYYLTKMQDEPWWSEDLDAFKKKYFDTRTEEEKREVLTENIDPHKLTRKQFQLLKDLGGCISSYVDKRTNMVTISVEMQDAEVAAQIATKASEMLQLYIIDYRTSKARVDVEYIQKIADKALEDYKEAQRVYSEFADANQDLVLVSVQQEEERLENEMQMAFTNYSNASTQLQAARAKVQERTPAFTILQPAGVAVKPNGPKRVVFTLMMTFLAFLFSTLWVLIRHAYKKAKRERDAAQRQPAEEGEAVEPAAEGVPPSEPDETEADDAAPTPEEPKRKSWRERLRFSKKKDDGDQ